MVAPKADGSQVPEAWSDVVPREVKPEEHAQEATSWVNVMKKVLVFLSWSLIGVLEGFVMVKTMVAYPKVLADQFVFKNFVVLKMFLSAVASSMFFQGCLSLASPAVFAATRKHAQNSYGYWRVIAGLMFTGMGMAICGSGTTMIAPSMGALVTTSPCLLVGAMVGVLFFGLLDRVLKRFGIKLLAARRVRPQHANRAQDGDMNGQVEAGQSEPVQLVPVTPHTVEKLVGSLLGREVSYAAVAVPLGLAMLLVCTVLELTISHTEDVAYCGAWQEAESSFHACPAWPPTVLGLVIGLGQVPVRLMHGSGMGGSGSFKTIASTLTNDALFRGNSLQSSLKNGFSSWQLVYNFMFVLTGAFLASFTAVSSEHIPANHPLLDGFSRWQAGIGMFIAVGGALFAGGCTCGHGVSGVSELALESWFGAGALFATAIATRYGLVSIGFD